VVDKIRAFHNHPDLWSRHRSLAAGAGNIPEERRERRTLSIRAQHTTAMAQGCDYEKQLKETGRWSREIGRKKWRLVYQSRSVQLRNLVGADILDCLPKSNAGAVRMW